MSVLHDTGVFIRNKDLKEIVNLSVFMLSVMNGKSWKDMIEQRVCTEYRKLGNRASPVLLFIWLLLSIPLW